MSIALSCERRKRRLRKFYSKRTREGGGYV
jgi:hypothetical protein